MSGYVRTISDVLKEIETVRDQQLKTKKKKLSKELNATGRTISLKEYLRNYLLKNPCIRCGNPNIMVLEFDHRNREEKSFAVGEGITLGVELEELKAEVAKCDVLCANCHAIKTHMENDSWRYKTELLKFSGQFATYAEHCGRVVE